MRALMLTLLLASMNMNAAPLQPWLPKDAKVADTFESRFSPPPGFVRKPCGPACAFLRSLPLKPGRPEVRLFDGRRKENQSAQLAVVVVEPGGDGRSPRGGAGRPVHLGLRPHGVGARRLGAADAAGIAATYGSVSAVTFITATGYLTLHDIPYSAPHIPLN
jgi:hypothetical protein